LVRSYTDAVAAHRYAWPGYLVLENNNKETKLKKHTLLVICVLTGAILAAPSWADKPEWAGKGNGGREKNERAERRDDERGREGRREHFKEQDRSYVREYYEREYHGGHCPSGLAKKHNGCMPPGQAKKWAYGRPLPRDVRYYPVPEPVIVRIGPPPSGYKYVRVASDILLIAVGSGLVVDAITDLGRM
jgi:Ni/Co efflux regulator RcnB